MKTVAAAIVVISAILLYRCHSTYPYDGDGILVDRGWLVWEGNRYTLDLGPIDLTTQNTYSFNLRHLPNAETTAGVRIIRLDKNRSDSPAPIHPSVIELELKSSNGDLIILEGGRLDEWTRSYGLGPPVSA